ncbi:MAG: hypothetical protein HY291_21670 [Planctomycetes bacterium]|nr:hypothetical protein [Planctomycetota bacterium]
MDPNAAPVEAPARAERTSRATSPRLFLATLCVFAGIMTVLAVPAVPPTVYVFGKVPLIILLATLAPILVLGGWMVLKQSYSLQTLLLGILGAGMLLTFARYQVVNDYADEKVRAAYFHFVPNEKDRAALQSALEPKALAKLFDPAFGMDGYEPGFGLGSLRLEFLNTVLEEDLGDSSLSISLRKFRARHAEPERPYVVVIAYTELKAHAMSVAHATPEYKDRYKAAFGRPFPANFTVPDLGVYPLTLEGSLEIFCDRIKQDWDDPLPLLKAIVERDPDEEMRKAAVKMYEAKKLFVPAPEKTAP